MFLSPHDLISSRQNGRTQKWLEAVGVQSRDVRDCSDGMLTQAAPEASPRRERELQRAGPEAGVPMAASDRAFRKLPAFIFSEKFYAVGQ
jgi:hypothetical protein